MPSSKERQEVFFNRTPGGLLQKNTKMSFSIKHQEVLFLRELDGLLQANTRRSSSIKNSRSSSVGDQMVFFYIRQDGLFLL